MNPVNPAHLDYRAERVDKYFNPIPDPPSYGGPLAVAIGGGVLVLLGMVLLGRGSSGACPGVLAFVAGVWLAVKGVRPMMRRYHEYVAAKNLSEPRATDQEMTDWLQDGLEMAIEMGYRRLNLNPAEATIERGAKVLPFTGLPDSSAGFHVRLAMGDDGTVRSSYYKILVVYLSGYRLSTYECVLEMRTGATVTDATKEYHLQDVGGMETVSDRVSFELPRTGSATAEKVEVTSRQLLRLMVSGRPAISLVMGISGSARLRIDSTGGSQVPGPEEMISTLREYLRTHKGGVLGNPAGLLPPQWPAGGLPATGVPPQQLPPHLAAPDGSSA